MIGDEKLVPSGDSEEYSKRNSGEENSEFFQGAVTRQYEAHQCIGFHNFFLGGKGASPASQRHSAAKASAAARAMASCNSPGTVGSKNLRGPSAQFTNISQGGSLIPRPSGSGPTACQILATRQATKPHLTN